MEFLDLTVTDLGDGYEGTSKYSLEENVFVGTLRYIIHTIEWINNYQLIVVDRLVKLRMIILVYIGGDF